MSVAVPKFKAGVPLLNSASAVEEKIMQSVSGSTVPPGIETHGAWVAKAEFGIKKRVIAKVPAIAMLVE